MAITLSQKETTLLKDLKGQEQLCIDKYKKHAECAHDPQLKQLFNNIASVEQQHYDMLTQIESGTTPVIQEQSGQAMQSTSFTATYNTANTPEKTADTYLCSDLLTTEKHVSSLYNTCVFEFTQPELRRALNKIQTDEQWHGEKIWQYMKTNSMYS